MWPFYRAEPDLEFEGLLKRQHTRVKYFQGSLMNAMDLERAKVGGQKAPKTPLFKVLFGALTCVGELTKKFPIQHT